MSDKKPTTPFPQLEVKIRSIWNLLPGEFSNVAKNHFDENFERQGYYDEGGRFIQWKGRKMKEFGGNRALLIKSGRLRRSLKSMPGMLTARVVSDAPHADIHNSGGDITITPKMRRYFWAMYYKSGGGSKRVGMSNRARTRAAQSEYWRSLAMAKGPLHVPKRTFMNANPVVLKEINAHALNRLKNVFKR